MVNELPRLPPRPRETKTEYRVIEPRFEIQEQNLAGHTTLPRCLIEEVAELTFEQPIGLARFLLLFQLKCVLARLRAAVAHMLYGRVGLALQRLAGSETRLFEQTCNRLHRASITRHNYLPLFSYVVHKTHERKQLRCSSNRDEIEVRYLTCT